MEKLEEILHAEERARHTVADARAKARDIRTSVASDAEVIMAEASREAAEEAAAITGATLRDADAEAARYAAVAEKELAAFVRRAEGHVEDAVRAAIDDLAG